MAVLLTGDILVAVLAFGLTDWVANNPIIASILAGLLVLVFFFYLLLRRTVQGFKEGMQGGR